MIVSLTSDNTIATGQLTSIHNDEQKADYRDSEYSSKNSILIGKEIKQSIGYRLYAAISGHHGSPLTGSPRRFDPRQQFLNHGRVVVVSRFRW